MIACETEAFYWRAWNDLNDATNVLRSMASSDSAVSAHALEGLVFFEHTLQFFESLQVLTASRVPTGTLTNALALMIGSGAQSPFLPYFLDENHLMKTTTAHAVSTDAPLLVQNSVSGMEARLFRGAVGFNIDPEIHRFSNIPDESIWHVRFVGVEYLKQYGYRNNDGTVQFNLSDEKVILESNILNLWNYTAH
jgi:hypothetical protein